MANPLSPAPIVHSANIQFKAPFPPGTPIPSTPGPSTPTKQRRVSIALPSESAPRLAPAVDFRDDTGVASHVPESEQVTRTGRARKTVAGDEFGSGHSPEKKLRKKWGDAETNMLVAGCNKHGVGNWKTILSDPEYTFDNRSPVDLKDRFRTYFPDAYKHHYPNARTHLSSKIRSLNKDGTSMFEKTRSKKRRPFTEEEDRALKAGYEKHGTLWAAIVKDAIFQEHGRRSTDLRDRFRNAYPDLYEAAGYKPRAPPKKKEVPAQVAADDQAAAAGPVRRKRRNTNLRGGTQSASQSAAASEDEGSDNDAPTTGRRPRSRSASLMATLSIVSSTDQTQDADEVMNSLLTMDPSTDDSWAPGTDTPTHSHWGAGPGSPTSSHQSSDYLLSSHPSPFASTSNFSSFGTIGNSQWGDKWLADDPRMEPSSAYSSSSSFNDHSLPPSSPFSLSHLNHGVQERFDLAQTYTPHDVLSDTGLGDSHAPLSADPRGMTHHSTYAGDLIFGARYPHQLQGNYYSDSSLSMGLGLSGMTPSMSPTMSSIEEFSGINLNDNNFQMEGILDNNQSTKVCSPSGPESSYTSSSTSGDYQSFQSGFALDELVDIPPELRATPPGTPHMQPQRHRSPANIYSTMHGRSISVPPHEARIPAPQRPAHLNTTSQPDLTGHQQNFFSPRQTMAPPPPPQQTYSTPSMNHTSLPSSSSDSNAYGLSFLDLHYYNNGEPTNGGWGQVEQRPGQALDLAAVPAPSSQPLPPPPPSAYASMSSKPSSSSPLTRSYSTGRALGRQQHQQQLSTSSMHQRGQSASNAAVCPQDLMLEGTNAMDTGTIGRRHNRASWDGARMLNQTTSP